MVFLSRIIAVERDVFEAVISYSTITTPTSALVKLQFGQLEGHLTNYVQYSCWTLRMRFIISRGKGQQTCQLQPHAQSHSQTTRFAEKHGSIRTHGAKRDISVLVHIGCCVGRSCQKGLMRCNAAISSCSIAYRYATQRADPHPPPARLATEKALFWHGFMVSARQGVPISIVHMCLVWLLHV